jgi:hypothetical protein
MKGKQHISDELVRPVRLDAYSRPAARDYLEIPIKEDILEALEWLPGDEDEFLRVQPQIEEVDDSSFVVLELTLGEEDERESYKLKSGGGYSVTLPATWESHQEEHRGHPNPFYGLEYDDQVVVVGFSNEGRIRVYHPEDYRKRTGLDIKAPSLAVLANSLFSNDFVDIAGQTPYDGQKWEIVPFDAQHRIFSEKVITSPEQSNNSSRSDDDFDRAVELNRLPTVRARRIRVWWNPFYQYPSKPESGGTVDSKPVTKEIEAGAFVVYQDYLTRCSQVILPEKGAFMIEADVRNGFGWIGAGFYSDSLEWDVRYSTDEDDCLRMYVPTPTEFKQGREPRNAIEWMNGAYGPRNR